MKKKKAHLEYSSVVKRIRAVVGLAIADAGLRHARFHHISPLTSGICQIQQ